MFLCAPFCVLFAAAVFGLTQSATSDSRESLIQELFDKVHSEQAKKTVPFVPFLHLYQKKGVYASYVKLNFYGNLAAAEARKLASVYDNNMFATVWVTSSLLEAHLAGLRPELREEQLISAIDSMASHHNQNKPFNNSLMTFWEQRYNQTTKYYQCEPENLIDLLNYANDFTIETIEELLKILGLESLEKEFANIMRMKDAYTQAFKIPPDFDDSFVNLGLGSLLSRTRQDFPNAWARWVDYNTNITSVFDAVKKYAYRPFSNDSNVNIIDPRTFYWMRNFLGQARERNQTVAIVTTWIQNYPDLRTEYYKGVAMPYFLNNVDATVAANTVYGMTAAFLNELIGPEILDDPVIESVYHNTSAVIVQQVLTNMTDRPELVLLYYPSRLEFYWFVARTLDLLETAKAKGPLPRQVMEEVYVLLKNASEGEMTRYILSHGQSDGRGGVFYDDFLGDGDRTLDNETLVRGEDRIFTTAMAANALLYTWTTYDESTKAFSWKQDAPLNVTARVSQCIHWLTENALGGHYEPWNAFFSGSLKTWETNAYNYPWNLLEYLNGTKIIDPSKIDPHQPVIVGLQGYVDPKEYQKIIEERANTTMPVPRAFKGYNTGTFPFPLWSSPAYTYTTTMLALTRFENIA